MSRGSGSPPHFPIVVVGWVGWDSTTWVVATALLVERLLLVRVEGIVLVRRRLVTGQMGWRSTSWMLRGASVLGALGLMGMTGGRLVAGRGREGSTSESCPGDKIGQTWIKTNAWQEREGSIASDFGR